MKKLLVLISASALLFSSCQTKAVKAEGEDGAVAATEQEQVDEQKQEKRKTGKKVRKESDSLSYAIGVDLGNHLKNNIKGQVGDDLNVDMVFAAIRDVMKERPTLTMEESYAFLNEFFSVRIPAKKKAEGEAFLADVLKKNPNAKKTDSGLIYEIIDSGSEVKPSSLADQVRVMYRGTLKDGEEFDSSYERGDTAQFMLSNVVTGWGEGLQLVGEGGKIKLWIPSELGYGERGAGGMIGPNEPIMFEVELFEVIPAEVEEETAE